VLALSAAVLDGLLALALVVAGTWMARASSSGVEQAAGRDDFAVGMFLGAVAWAGWISALIVAGFAFVSWRIYKRLGRPAGWRVIDIVGVALALVPIIVVASYAGHQLLSR
jgi:phosphoglycerol transferase MdoB-like AlkP superfamily enzyme